MELDLIELEMLLVAGARITGGHKQGPQISSAHGEIADTERYQVVLAYPDGSSRRWPCTRSAFAHAARALRSEVQP